jgi:hypothetical protein
MWFWRAGIGQKPFWKLALRRDEVGISSYCCCRDNDSELHSASKVRSHRILAPDLRRAAGGAASHFHDHRVEIAEVGTTGNAVREEKKND